jgi:NADPH:quinone reductase-like Zn-dependent oxidoreductase
VNVVDYKIRSGNFPYVTENNLPMFLGYDLAGTIEEADPEAARLCAWATRSSA